MAVDPDAFPNGGILMSKQRIEHESGRAAAMRPLFEEWLNGTASLDDVARFRGLQAETVAW